VVINTNARPKMMAMTTEIMLELALCEVWKNCIKDGTTRARIPEKIMSETPFPKPFMVNTSPSQNKNMDPAARIKVVTTADWKLGVISEEPPTAKP